MGRVPVDLRSSIASNIRTCRMGRYPMWGGAKRCAKDFGVSPQQWSQWERGLHMPDEEHLAKIALFFGVSSEDLRRDTFRGGPMAEPPPPPPRDGGVTAVRIVNGVETPLKVEVERVVYHLKYNIRMERIL